MKKLNEDDTIKMGVYSGLTVRECVKRYGKKSLLEVLRYYDLDDEFSKRYYYKKIDQKEVQTNDKKEENFFSLSVDGKNKDKKGKKRFDDRGYNDPPFYDEFTPFWGPGSSYKPWIYGK